MSYIVCEGTTYKWRFLTNTVNKWKGMNFTHAYCFEKQYIEKISDLEKSGHPQPII
jgi:hypothetical protein